MQRSLAIIVLLLLQYAISYGATKIYAPAQPYLIDSVNPSTGATSILNTLRA